MMIRPDKIIRSDRKTLAISVDAFNRLIVRAPKRCSEERIFAFLQAKEEWILRKKSENMRAGVRLPPENLDGYELLLLGKPCKIRLEKRTSVGFDGEKCELVLPETEPKKRLVKWLKENAKRILGQVTAEKAREMGATYKSASVTSAKTRWGSCSFDNALHYSFRLIYAPKAVVEYVVVHELAHTRYKNHSALFWAEVARYIPDWKERRKWLKLHGALMEVF